jgi:hypothetical protein
MTRKYPDPDFDVLRSIAGILLAPKSYMPLGNSYRNIQDTPLSLQDIHWVDLWRFWQPSHCNKISRLRK